MSDFSFKYESVGGAVTGYLPGIEKMGNAEANVEPQESTIELAIWQPGKFDPDGVYSEWEACYTHTYFNVLDCYTLPDLCSALYNSGYRTINSALEVCRFALNDEYGHPLQDKMLSLLSWSDNGGAIVNCVCRRLYDSQTQTWTYTPISQTFGWAAAMGSSSYGYQCGRFQRGSKLWYSFGMCVLGYSDRQCEAYLALNTHDNLVDLIGGTPGGEDIDLDFGPESQPGGYGGSGEPAPTFDGTSDPWVDTPTKPGVLSFGLLNVYKCDQGALNNLGADLFPEITWPPSTGFSDLLEWLGETIQAFSDSVWNKGLIDYIVSVHLIPIDVSAGALEDIKIGPRTMTGILARPITDDVIEIDCGTVHVDEYYTNYVDYMTQCRVYIPYYGMISIKPEYWQSADINLKYLWNVMDGSFIAKLYSTITRHQTPCTSLIGQYSGSACVHMPLSGANYANMFAQLAGGIGGAAAGIASGNVAMAATSAMNYAGSIGGVGNMEQSNAYNASSAFYGHARPFLLIERPVSHFSRKYVAECGLPVLVTKRIGACSGLTICEDPILNFACPDDEAEAIKAALREGVIV